jgi:hypothetical protein
MSGLDPRARRLTKEAKQKKENEPPPLNPPFPFRRLAFDPWFFGLEDDPPKEGEQPRRD